MKVNVASSFEIGLKTVFIGLKAIKLKIIA